MDTLKRTQIPQVYVADLDAYIELLLLRPWSTQQDLMAGQDTLHTFDVFPDPDATAKVAEWLASPVPPYNTWGRDEIISTEELLSELCNRGLLDEGKIHVHVWW